VPGVLRHLLVRDPKPGQRRLATEYDRLGRILWPPRGTPPIRTVRYSRPCRLACVVCILANIMRTRLVAALLFALSQVVFAQGVDIDIPYQKFVLKNGLTLIVHEDHKAPIVAVNVWYHVGSKNEKGGKTGFAHLFEHLMFGGSEHFKRRYIEA